MAELLKGAAAAAAITDDLIARTRRLNDQGIVPCLAILRVGERVDDLSYERAALKRQVRVPGSARQDRAVSHEGHQAPPCELVAQRLLVAVEGDVLAQRVVVQARVEQRRFGEARDLARELREATKQRGLAHAGRPVHPKESGTGLVAEGSAP